MIDPSAAGRTTRWRSLAAPAVLLALICAVLGVGRLFVYAFPVTVEIAGDGTDLTITVDGTTRRVTTVQPIVALRPVGPVPFRREHLIDGSDSTNMLTFDPEYLRTLAASPYYRFQAWLREAWRYSRWVRLEVRDAAGTPTLRDPAPLDDVPLELPNPFHLTIALERPEIPRALDVLDADNGVLTLEINRNDKFVRFGPGRQHDASDLAFWYFPRDVLPPLATLVDLLTRVLALALALPLVAGLLGLVLPAPIRWQPGCRTLRESLVIGAGAFLAGSNYFAVAVFDRAPHILDSIAYLFQARTFASGALAAVPAPVTAAFPIPFSAVFNGLWFVQYPPGTAALLAVGLLLDVPWLVQPLLGAGAIVLLVLAARHQYGPGTALVTLVLAATSPFLLLNAGAFLSHVPSLFCATLALYGATRYAERPATRWAVLVGVGLGLALLTREVVTVLYGLTIVAAGLARGAGWGGRSPRRLAADLAALFACVGVAGALYVAYNTALTGNPLLLPRLLIDTRERHGFGPGIGFYNEHTVASGLVNAEQQLVSLSFMLAGWPFGFSLAVLVLPFVLAHRLRQRSWWDLAHGGLIALYVTSFVAWFYHGIAFGPRYYFEALPSLVILSARGFWALTAAVAAWLTNLGFATGWWRAQQAVCIIGAALLACNALYFLPRQAALYTGYSGIPGHRPALDDTITRTLAGRASTLDNALVVSRDWWVHSMYFAALNCPNLDCPTVFAYANDDRTRALLREAFPDRRWYTVENRDGILRIEEAVP